MTLQELNSLDKDSALAEFTKCCGASKWAKSMANSLPYADERALYMASDWYWGNCSRLDYLEAFTHHPKIGDVKSLEKKFASTADWASGEQASIATASKKVIEDLAEGNTAYEEKFNFIFIVCATGKSAAEMLDLLQYRLPNKPDAELRIAAAEQHKITRIRLEKLLT